MSWLEFIAAMASALAWPMAAVIVAVLFRKQLRALLDGPLSKLRAGPLEVEWDLRAASTEVDVEQAATTEVDAGTPDARLFAGDTVAELTGVAKQSPMAAVMAGFAKVETALRELLSGKAPEVAVQGFGAVRLARAGLELGLVTQESVRAIEGLAVLRNLAAHGKETDLGVQRAIDYLVMVDAILFALGHRPDDTS